MPSRQLTTRPRPLIHRPSLMCRSLEKKTGAILGQRRRMKINGSRDLCLPYCEWEVHLGLQKSYKRTKHSLICHIGAKRAQQLLDLPQIVRGRGISGKTMKMTMRKAKHHLRVTAISRLKAYKSRTHRETIAQHTPTQRQARLPFPL
jgi:hypothetical protein